MKACLLALLLAVSSSPVFAQSDLFDTSDIGSQVYLTDHPNDPSAFGLATHRGRYAAYPTTEGCEWVSSETNVSVADYALGLVWISPVGRDGPRCGLMVTTLMDSTPCFTTAGICDIAQELADAI